MKIINFIIGYHPQVFRCFPEENVFLMINNVAIDIGKHSEVAIFKPQCDVTQTPGRNDKIYVKYLYTYKEALAYLRKNRKNFIYSNTLTIISLLVGIIAKKSMFMPHDPPIPKSWIKKQIVLFFYRFFSYIRVVSDAEKEYMKKYGLHNAIVIPLAISERFYQPDKVKKNNILLLGNITHKKDPITILKALQIIISKYPKIKIYQIGISDQFTFEGKHYYELVKDFGLDNNTIYIYGQKTHQEIIDMKLDSSIYINSSHAEGQCLSVYDATLLGHAACLPNILAFTDALNNNALFHNPYDYDKLAENILRYIENPIEKEKMIKINQEYTLQKYNYDIIKSKFQKLILY